ncbi:MAG: hypothetical protein LBT90_04270 [Holosporaceae bacterium]|jgi:hypothetical protein|nr:hypothetical protein [Holosporaceae bacterium]
MFVGVMINNYPKFSLKVALVWTIFFSDSAVVCQPVNDTAKTIAEGDTGTDQVDGTGVGAVASTGTSSDTQASAASVSNATASAVPATPTVPTAPITTSTIPAIPAISSVPEDLGKKSQTSRTDTNIHTDVLRELDGVTHRDSLPSIFSQNSRIISDGQSFRFAAGQPKSVEKNNEMTSISLRCYKNFCLVKDIRRVPVRAGINTTEFKKLYAGLMSDSFNFRTPKRGKINVLGYTFHQRNLTRQNLFQSSIGNDVFFRLDDRSSNLDKGTLLAVSAEGGVCYAIIGNRADQKCFIVPLKQCIALDCSKKKSPIDQDFLVLSFESEESGDIDLELSYLTSNITWKYVCIIDVFEKLDRIDVFSQAFVKNNTGFDLDNVPIIFDTSTESIGEAKSSAEQNTGASSITNITNLHAQRMIDSSDSSYGENFSIKNNSSSVCVLKSTKEIKPTLEYAAQFPKNFFDEQSSSEISLPVNNLLIVENAKKICVDSTDSSSYAVIFRRTGNNMSFVNKLMMSSIKKEDRLVLEMGQASGIIVMARQTDFKRLSETQVECGVCVSVKNEKATDSAVLITAEVGVPWSVTKTNFEIQKSKNPAWRIELKAGELKELHYRIRIAKK